MHDHRDTAGDPPGACARAFAVRASHQLSAATATLCRALAPRFTGIISPHDLKNVSDADGGA